jgi:hypothetical protein
MLIGAGFAASAVILDENTITALASTKWNMNEELKQALLDQSRAARNGLVLVAVGSFLQVIGVFFFKS